MGPISVARSNQSIQRVNRRMRNPSRVMWGIRLIQDQVLNLELRGEAVAANPEVEIRRRGGVSRWTGESCGGDVQA